MDITEFNINLDLAKKAAKESGKLLLENKKELNKRYAAHLNIFFQLNHF